MDMMNSLKFKGIRNWIEEKNKEEGMPTGNRGLRTPPSEKERKD
jgi:hypothetical protein